MDKIMKWVNYYRKYGVIILFITIAVAFFCFVKTYAHCDLLDPALVQENIEREYKRAEERGTFEFPRDRIIQDYEVAEAEEKEAIEYVDKIKKLEKSMDG